MSLPFSEKEIRNRKRKGLPKKVKLPTSMQSKFQKKCPICQSPYVNKCVNCGYTFREYYIWNKDNLFQKAKESYEREKRLEEL